MQGPVTTVLVLVLADVAGGLALVGLSRALAGADRWEHAAGVLRFRLAAPLPLTRLLDRVHGLALPARVELMGALRVLGRRSEAAVEAERLLARPALPGVLRAVAVAARAEQLVEDGALGEAIHAVDEELGRWPPVIERTVDFLRSIRSSALRERGDWLAARLELEALPEEEDGVPVRAVALVHLLQAQGRHREALLVARPWLTRWRELGPDREELQPFRFEGGELVASSWSAHEVGWSELRDRLLGVVDALPSVAPQSAALVEAVRLAAVVERAGFAASELDALVARVERALDRVDGSPLAQLAPRRLLARSLASLDRRAEALEVAALAMRRARTPLARTRAAETLAGLLEAAGRRAEAERAWRRVLEAGIEGPWRERARARLPAGAAPGDPRELA